MQKKISTAKQSGQPDAKFTTNIHSAAVNMTAPLGKATDLVEVISNDLPNA